MPPTMLAPRSLRKASVPPALLSDPTPGSLQPTRLAVHVNGDGSSCSAYLGSGCSVYKIEVHIPTSIAPFEVFLNLFFSLFLFFWSSKISMDGATLSKGKESLLIPDNAQVISSSVVDRCPHRSEIQSVALAEGKGDNCLILGTIDSYGHLIVSRLDVVADGPPIQYYLVIVVLGKAVGLGLWYPSSFSFVQCSAQVNESSSLLAIAEGSQLSIWDLRMNSNGGCVQRISGSIGDIIYSVCSSPSGPIAIGGTDRAVTIYDPRRLNSLDPILYVGGLLCQDGWAAPNMRLQAFHSHQLTNLLSTSKVLTMRLPVDVGKKANEHSHFEAIPIGWAFQSVPILMW
nr:unnamed protein product [Digitaria exilis]